MTKSKRKESSSSRWKRWKDKVIKHKDGGKKQTSVKTNASAKDA